ASIGQCAKQCSSQWAGETAKQHAKQQVCENAKLGIEQSKRASQYIRLPTNAASNREKHVKSASRKLQSIKKSIK
ncbi:MAG: hypothetical protein E6493_06810, partial [Alloscardovia omnicolens]|nr:hypothetical protein [Alloscardovia omnicolens]